MNVRLKDSFSFTAAVWFNDTLLVNNYHIQYQIITNVEDSETINTARDRLKWLQASQLFNTVFINQKHTEVIEKLLDLDIKLVTLPEDPIDQIIGLMLFSKLEAIFENILTVVELEISSDLSDGVVFPHTANETLGPFEAEGWWIDSGPELFYKTEEKDNDERVVKLHNKTTWRELELDWPKSKS